jgi:serine/threonine-protein kinase
VPSLVDNYSIISPLGEGGMAEIYLAKKSGPAEFERIVVLKHVRAEHSDDPEFIDLFLAEARLIAKIRHPNVVQVYDLGRNESGMFLALEYLHGENARALLQALSAQALQLDPALAAFVVAEAAAGLHAAHELTDAHGRSEGVVHRDVSPDNMLLTYDGDVKVIDFGIAKGARSRNRTEPGVVRGKAAYVAPEQILGRPVDRRTDVFALGIVLWELLTVRRLFRRTTLDESWEAILNEPIPSVRSFQPSCPEALAQICARALAREPDDRFASAEVLRKALVTFMLGQGLSALPRDSLASLMQQLFSDARTSKEQLLNRAQVRVSVRTVPLRTAAKLPSGTHSAPPLSGGEHTPYAPYARESPTPIATTPPPRAREAATLRPASGGAPVWLIGVAIVMLATAVLAGVYQGKRRAAHRPPTVVALAPAAPPPAAPPTHVVLHVTSKPEGAALFIEDRLHGSTPLDLDVARGEGQISFELRLAGFQTLAATSSHESDHTLELTLVPLPAAEKHHAPPKTGRKYPVFE